MVVTIWLVRCTRYSEQLRRDWPGLSREVALLSQELVIENVNTIQMSEMNIWKWKNMVNKAVWKHNEQCLKEKMGEKLQGIKNESFRRKDAWKATG